MHKRQFGDHFSLTVLLRAIILMKDKFQYIKYRLHKEEIMNNPDRKTVLVTGSSRGIGRGIAIEMAGRGFNVAVNYSGNRDAASETLELCREKALDSDQVFKAFQADISIKEDRSRLLEEVIDAFGDFHSLVNNAGVAPKERLDLLEMSEESFDRLMTINLKGAFFLSQEVSRYWLSKESFRSDFRSLIFVTSVSSEMVSINRGEYCIAKTGLSMSAKLFARRLAAENIGVYEIRPGIIKTDMTGGVKEKYDKLISGGLVPQKRWGFPSDIGSAAASLVQGDFAYSSGSVINVDGGLHIPEL